MRLTIVAATGGIGSQLLRQAVAAGHEVTAVVRLIATGVWPYNTVVLVVTNDLIWWIPFSRYLLDTWPNFKATWRSP